MANAVQLSNVQSTLLPPTVTGPIFDKVTEVSAVQQLAQRVPLSVNATTAIPVSMDIPQAGWVSEGGSKPVGSGAVGVKTMTGKKVALLVPLSEEVVNTNAAGLYSHLVEILPKAISRSFDYAAIHGKDLRTGGAGPFTDYLKNTPNVQELGTTTQVAGGMYADLVKGEQQVANQNFDFSGFAVDPRLKPTLKLQVDTTGRPIWVDDPTQGLNASSLIGYPSYSNPGVSGSYRYNGSKVQTITITGTPTGGTFTVASGGNTYVAAYNVATATLQAAIRAWGGSATAPAGTTLRAIGGDWSQCAYGVGMDISIKVSNSASYTDEAAVVHSAFQENLVLLLVEAYYGFVVGNNNAFVAYTDLT
jgi:hypothetical protein